MTNTGSAMAEDNASGQRSGPSGGDSNGHNPKRDRRTATRYQSVWSRAWLGWKEQSQFHCAPCWIQDIGLGGVRLGLHELPPIGVPLVLRLDGEWLPNWYEVRILEVLPNDQPGFATARMAFPAACPFELFMAVAYGHIGASRDYHQPHLADFHADAVDRSSRRNASSPFSRSRTVNGTREC